MRSILTLLIVVLGFCGCQKTKLTNKQKRLPIATEAGRGIFGCYINNATYVARRLGEVKYNAETGYLFLENSYEDFEFRLFVYEGITGPGTYSFDNTGEEWVSADFTDFYGIEPGGVNELIITKLDVPEKIISGTFNIDLVSEVGEQKAIREGRFDLNLTVF